MADYATLADVKQYAYQWQASDEPVLQALATRASRLFDRLAEVADDHFAARTPGAATARVFYGDGTDYLRLDPRDPSDPVAAADVSMPAGYTVPSFYESGDYLVRAYGAGALYGAGAVHHHGGTGEGWPDGVPVTVTAKWGYASVPADVTHAAARLAVHLWRTSDPARMATVAPELPAATYPQEVLDVALKYRQRSGLVFA
jgi:hypothetical protein